MQQAIESHSEDAFTAAREVAERLGARLRAAIRGRGGSGSRDTR